MSAAQPLRIERIAPATRPIIDAPGLHVVPTPAPARGFFGAVLLCALLFIGSLGVAFHLNTLMVSGAYELKNISLEYNEVSAREATLRSEVIEVSTPKKLQQAATDLKMVPAPMILHLDLDAGVVSTADRK